MIERVLCATPPALRITAAALSAALPCVGVSCAAALLMAPELWPLPGRA